MARSHRRSGRTAIFGAILLIATFLAAVPGTADDLTPTITVFDQWGISVGGDGWAGGEVTVEVYEGAALWSSTVVPVEGNQFGVHLGDPGGFGPGWSVAVTDSTHSRALAIPLLTIDRVDTYSGDVSGAADVGLAFVVETCTDDPSCEQVSVTGTGSDWTAGPLTVTDRDVSASYTDDDGDSLRVSYLWPGLGYQRWTSRSGMGHSLGVSMFPVNTPVSLSIDAPGVDLDRRIDGVTDEGGNWQVDLSAVGIEPADVGAGWTFNADMSVGGWTMHKELTGRDLTIEGVDQVAGTAHGACGGDFEILIDLIRGQWFDPPEGLSAACTSATWGTSWAVDETAVPIVGAWGQEPDNDRFAVQWYRPGLSIGDDGINALSLGFHEWDMSEPTTLTITDEDGGAVWSGVVNDVVVPTSPDEPGRFDLRLDAIIDPEATTDGWTFRAESATQLKSLVRETVTIDRNPDGTVAINEAGEITGTAPPDRFITVVTFADGVNTWSDAWSDSAGIWAIGPDLTGVKDVQVWLNDRDGDGNVLEAPVTLSGGFDNRIQAELTFDYLRGEGFTPGNSVTVTLKDGDDDVVFETVADVYDANGDGQFFVQGDELDVRPGLRFEARENQEPFRYRVLDIVDARFESFDEGTLTVAGWAPARPFDGEIRLHLFDQDELPIDDEFGGPISVYPESSQWSVRFTPWIDEGVTVTGLTTASVEIPDVPDEGTTASNGTFASLPAFEAFPQRGEVRSDWFDGYDTVTIEVLDSEGALRWTTTEPVGERGQFHAGGGRIEPGDEVVVTGNGDGYTITKRLVVSPLAVSEFTPDSEGGTVFIAGSAEAGARVIVDVGNEFGGNRAVVHADGDGYWEHTFEPDDLPGGVTVDMGFHAAVMDEDLDQTGVEPQEPPRFTVDITNDVVVAERWSDPEALILTIDGEEFRGFFVGEQGEIIFETGIDLVGGEHVVMTDGSITKEHDVMPLAVTGIDGPFATGLGTPESFIQVFNQFEGGGAFRGLTTESDGTFSVDFSTDPEPPIEGEGVLTEIVLGVLGVMAPDEDGDATVTLVDPPWVDVWLPEEPMPVDIDIDLGGIVHRAPPGTTATIDWGDGSDPEKIPVNDSDAYAEARFSATHDFTEAGVYPVVVTAEVDDEQIADSGELFIVIYDPDGGFVTGGGSIESPAGAYGPDPSATGRATFGFVSKYKDGARVPDGQTEFRLHGADLNFHSTSNEWLVVTTSDSAIFTGRGAVNGIAGYHFVVWATDGATDTFRIAIWSDGEAEEYIVYDSGFQPLDGGNVVVHKPKEPNRM